jgi:cytochrome c-type biogenesis protein CcmE
MLRRRWRYLIISLAFLSLYMAILSGAVASGFAYYDRLDPTFQTDIAQTSAPIWSQVATTYNCAGTSCVTALENAMYSNKQRIGIISAVFLLVPGLTILIIMFQMRQDILYFK